MGARYEKIIAELVVDLFIRSGGGENEETIHDKVGGKRHTSNN